MANTNRTFLGHSPRFQLKVTQKNIDDGVERNSNHCIAADALKEARPDLKYISVDIQTIRATDMEKKERYVWMTPRVIQKMIIDFDAGKKVDIKPFTTTLRDGQTIVAGYSEDEKRKRNSKTAKLRRPRKGSNSSPPIPVGGKAPPRAVGQRRQFGLRSLVY